MYARKHVRMHMYTNGSFQKSGWNENGPNKNHNPYYLKPQKVPLIVGPPPAICIDGSKGKTPCQAAPLLAAGATESESAAVCAEAGEFYSLVPKGLE